MSAYVYQIKPRGKCNCEFQIWLKTCIHELKFLTRTLTEREWCAIDLLHIMYGNAYFSSFSREGGRDSSYEEFLSDIMACGPEDCRYGLYDFEYEHQCQVWTVESISDTEILYALH